MYPIYMRPSPSLQGSSETYAVLGPRPQPMYILYSMYHSQLLIQHAVTTKGEGDARVACGQVRAGTREPPPDCVEKWVAEDKADGGVKADGEDVLAYFTVGVTHVPRPEDWPVNVLFLFLSYCFADIIVTLTGCRRSTSCCCSARHTSSSRIPAWMCPPPTTSAVCLCSR